MDTPTHPEKPAASPPGQPQAAGWRASLAGWLICLLVAASLVAWYVQDSPLAVARKYMSEQQRVAVDDLELVGYHSQHTNPYNWFGAIMSETTVEFRVKGTEHSKKRVVDLFRPIYFLPWRVSALREGTE